MTFKEKIKHFLYYYKWHMIIAIFTLIVVALLFKSCTMVKNPDINLAYISDTPVAADAQDRLFEILKENNFASDVNNDGETLFSFEPSVMSFEDTSSQNYQVYEKVQLQLSAGSQTLIFAHQYALEDYEWAFDDISKYAKDGDKTVTGTNGFVIGISVEGNKLLEEAGINTKNLYVSMHARTAEQGKKETLDAEYEHAYKIMKFILENQ